MALFRSLVFQLFSTEHSQSVSMDTLKAKVENDFDDVEMQAALLAMQDANQLMVADDTVFLI